MRQIKVKGFLPIWNLSADRPTDWHTNRPNQPTGWTANKSSGSPIDPPTDRHTLCIFYVKSFPTPRSLAAFLPFWLRLLCDMAVCVEARLPAIDWSGILVLLVLCSWTSSSFFRFCNSSNCSDGDLLWKKIKIILYFFFINIYCADFGQNHAGTDVL